MKRFIAGLGVVAVSLFGVACEPSEPETPGEAVEEAADAVGDAIEDAGDAVEEATE